MSKKVPGAFHDFGFWVYDVYQGLAFAEMAAVIEAAPEETRTEWTRHMLRELQVHAAISDFFIPVDEWAAGHEDEFVELAAGARDRLVARGTVTPEEARDWRILDELPIHWRGSTPISTDGAVRFAEALIGIVRGTYPAAPRGRRWYFGDLTPAGELTTIGVVEDE